MVRQRSRRTILDNKAGFADEDKARQRDQADGEGGETTGVALLREVHQRDQAQFGGPHRGHRQVELEVAAS